MAVIISRGTPFSAISLLLVTRRLNAVKVVASVVCIPNGTELENMLFVGEGEPIRKFFQVW